LIKEKTTILDEMNLMNEAAMERTSATSLIKYRYLQNETVQTFIDHQEWFENIAVS